MPGMPNPMWLAALLLVGGCPVQPVPGPSTTAGPTGDRPAWFTDGASAAGLDFVHVNGATGGLYYPEILPPGVALFDYDSDGDLDLYVAQGHVLAPRNPASALTAPGTPATATGRLFRNDLVVRADSTRDLRFVDVTDRSGIAAMGYGLGVATGDIDNDGWVDLYLTFFNASQMYRNNGDGTFADVTRTSGTGNAGGFGVSASFLDIDRDGWLDLYVGNNVRYGLDHRTVCPNPAGVPDYCPPQIYGGLPDRLYRNRGRGQFVDVTRTALAGGKFGPALGVSTADFNGDGWIDIFVANDGEDNLLWLNRRDGTFAEVGLASGVALTAEGKAEASMGVDAADFDNDGDEDLAVAELTGQGTNLYVNDGAGRFRDAGALSGIGSLSLPYTGWGTAWLDYDNDAWLDLLTVNGTIIAQEGRGGQLFPYDQRKLLLKNLGNGRFESVGHQAGPVFELSESGRGAAFGDIDNDGDTDVVVGNDNGPLRLLVNHIGNRQHWIGLSLVGREGRAMLGARVAVIRRGQPPLWRRARADGSYASASDPRVLVGLGAFADPVAVQVRWPNGEAEEWSDVAVDRWQTLTQGSGR